MFRTLLGASAALAITTVSASAAVFTYDLTDNGTSGFTTNGAGYNYGLRLDGYKGDGVDPQMIFSFSTAAGGSGATLQYDDVNGVVQIKGQMRRSLANDVFGDVWDVFYQIVGVDNYGAAGSGMFIDTSGTGGGSISDGTNTLSLGAKARGTDYFLLTDDSSRDDGTADLTGEGWVNTSSIWMTTNDFLFNADLADTDPNGNLPPVPLPATGLLLVAALGGLGAMRRRKTA